MRQRGNGCLVLMGWWTIEMKDVAVGWSETIPSVSSLPTFVSKESRGKEKQKGNGNGSIGTKGSEFGREAHWWRKLQERAHRSTSVSSS